MISGEVDAAAQQWGWSYFQVVGPPPARTLDVAVTADRPISGVPALGWAGARASFAFRTGLVAVIARDDAALAVWEEWNGASPGVAAVVLVGPYAVSGTVLTPDGTMASVLLNPVFAVRDATITRTDGRGDPAPLPVARAVVGTAHAQGAAVAGPGAPA